MKVWKVILATLVIFVAGIVTGALVTRFSHRIQEQERRAFFRENEMFPRGPFPSTNNFGSRTNREAGHLSMPYSTKLPSRAMAREFLERLDRELKLGPEQRKQLEKILGDSQKRSKEIWEKIAPELKEEMKLSRERMRDVLTPNQNKRLDELMKRIPKAPREGTATNSPPLPPAEPPANFTPPPTEPPVK